jgi:hypothetical protein
MQLQGAMVAKPQVPARCRCFTNTGFWKLLSTMGHQSIQGPSQSTCSSCTHPSPTVVKVVSSTASSMTAKEASQVYWQHRSFLEYAALPVTRKTSFRIVACFGSTTISIQH